MSNGASDIANGTSSPRAATLSETLARAAARLSAAGIASPRTDAELLAAHVLAVSRGGLLTAGAMTPEAAVEFWRLVEARASRVPLQHLTGIAPFRRLSLAVGPGVFVPRPETELLVEWGLSILENEAATVVDLCGGSGAIGLSVARERPKVTVHIVESDPGALRWLRGNLAALPAGGRVRVVEADATDPASLRDVTGRADLVLSNPPYVPAATPVAPEVADHDPAVAVFAGPDGLDVIRGLVPRAAALLRTGGWFGVEHDDSHGVAVPNLLIGDGRFELIEDHRDLADRPRFATARRV